MTHFPFPRCLLILRRLSRGELPYYQAIKCVVESEPPGTLSGLTYFLFQKARQAAGGIFSRAQSNPVPGTLSNFLFPFDVTELSLETLWPDFAFLLFSPLPSFSETEIHEAAYEERAHGAPD